MLKFIALAAALLVLAYTFSTAWALRKNIVRGELPLSMATKY